jgi:HlyD family secretion protein
MLEMTDKGRVNPRLIWVAAGAVVLGAVWLLAVAIPAGRKNDGIEKNPLLFAARRGPLVISVTESGTVSARDQVIISSEVEGSTTILSLVPEGTMVKEGELLIELDASEMEEEKFDQQLRVQNAEADYIRSRENLAITKSQAESDIEKAELATEFAGQDLAKYEEGEFPQSRKEAEAKIKLSEEEFQRTDEKLKWSRILFQEKYISETELQADELSLKKAELDLELAKGNRDLLLGFTHQRQMAQLKSDTKQTKMAMERARRKGKANILQAEADLTAKEMDFRRQKDRLAETEDQIIKTKIRAPSDGQVVYATSVKRSRWHAADEPLQEGQTVREREDLIYLPETKHMKVVVKIHESNLDRIKVGMHARITSDAIPGRSLTGYVDSIAPMPDPISVYLNPDLKVYDTQVHIDGDASDLRSGMTCEVEIIVETHRDVVYVPIQCVVRVDGKHTVYLVKDGPSSKKHITVGLDNNRMVHIIEGLTEGDEVMLAPPLEEAEVLEKEVAQPPQNETPPQQRPEHRTKTRPPGRGPRQGPGKKASTQTRGEKSPRTATE